MKVTKVQKALDILTFYCRHNLSLEKPYDWPQPCEQANSLRRQDRRPLSRKAAVKVRKPMISTKIVNCLCQLVNDGAVAVHSWLDLRRTIRRNSVELQNRVFKVQICPNSTALEGFASNGSKEFKWLSLLYKLQVPCPTLQDSHWLPHPTL